MRLQSILSIKIDLTRDNLFGSFLIQYVFIIRMASVESKPVLQNHAQCDYGFLEDLIKKCSSPLPNPFFSSIEFAEQFVFECDEMCNEFF